MADRRAYEVGLAVGDLHFPWQCDRAIELALRVADAAKPDRIYLNGDVTDCWQISRFDKNPRHEAFAGLRPEIARTREFLGALRKRFPDARITYIFGNHDFRWETFITRNARELHGLEGMTLEEQLHLAEYGIDAVNNGTRENSVLWGKLLIGHFDKVNKHSAYTAKNLLEDKSISLIQNHTHRGGTSFKRGYDRDLVAYENFCLCDRTPQYVDHPNWQLGFSLIFKDRASDFFYVEPHPITEVRKGSNRVTYRCFYQGECLVN